MNILILGGHGFIGHNIAIQLEKLGHTISIVDCHHRYGQFFEKEFISVLNQKMLAIGTHDFHYGSVGDTVFIESVFALFRPEIVINLATYSNINYVKNNVIDATENMIVSTAVILDLCVKYQISRFVFASSSMVYGSVSDETVPQLEDNICNPLTLYGSYKLQCEQMCKIWNAEHGLEYVILRPSSLYGIRDLTVRIISRMATEAMVVIVLLSLKLKIP